MFKGDSRLHVGGDIYHHDSEHAKLEAANKVLRAELIAARNVFMSLKWDGEIKNTAFVKRINAAIKAADEIERG